jgi:hypothetical protein
MSHSLHPAAPNQPAAGLRRWWGAVWLLPLLTVALNLVAIGWLYQSQRFAVTPASLTAAWLMTVVAIVPPLVRPGPASALSAAMGLQLAAIVAVAFTPVARYPLLVAAPVTEWSGGLVLRLLNMALFGPTLLWFTQVFPEESSDWLSRLAHPLLWLAVTGGLLAPAFAGIRLPLDANIAIGFLLTVCLIGVGTFRLARSAAALLGAAGRSLLTGAAGLVCADRGVASLRAGALRPVAPANRDHLHHLAPQSL